MPERQKELFTIKIDWETCSDVTKKNSKLLTTSNILGYSQNSFKSITTTKAQPSSACKKISTVCKSVIVNAMKKKLFIAPVESLQL